MIKDGSFPYKEEVVKMFETLGWKGGFGQYFNVGLFLTVIWILLIMAEFIYTSYVGYRGYINYLQGSPKNSNLLDKEFSFKEAIIWMGAGSAALYYLWGVGVVSLIIWFLTYGIKICLRFIKYTLEYFIDKSNLAFILTHPDDKIRAKGKKIKDNGFRTVIKKTFNKKE